MKFGKLVLCVVVVALLVIACDDSDEAIVDSPVESTEWQVMRADLRVTCPAAGEQVCISNDSMCEITVFIPEDLRPIAKRVGLYRDYETPDPFAVTLGIAEGAECCTIRTWGNEIGYCGGCFFPALETTDGRIALGELHRVVTVAGQ